MLKLDLNLLHPSIEELASKQATQCVGQLAKVGSNQFLRMIGQSHHTTTLQNYTKHTLHTTQSHHTNTIVFASRCLPLQQETVPLRVQTSQRWDCSLSLS